MIIVHLETLFWCLTFSPLACFGRPDRSVLEAKTKCKVSLSITDTSRIVNIDGDEENVNAAVEQVEDFLLTCIHGDNHKLMFMYDLAWINLSGEFKPGGILFQREKEVWKYMCVLELPFASREGFDLMKKEIMEMKRETECHFRLFRLITARLYISHESKAALEQSVLRARERIQQVNFMLQTMRGY